MKSDDLSRPDALPRIYAAWRLRVLAGALLATLAGMVIHGPTGDLRIELGDRWPSLGMIVGLAALAVGALGPGLAGTVLALAALRSWRRPGASSRHTRAAWICWVLGPLPILLLPLARLFGLEPEDSMRTSAHQVRHLLTVTIPAFFALLPGLLRSALALKRFLPESRAPGQIAMLVAPACAVAYLLPLAILTQLAFHPGLYLSLLLLAGSPLVPLLASRRLQRSVTPGEAARLVRTIALIQGALAASGVALMVRWLEGFAALRPWLDGVSALWVAGLVAKMLASKWLTEVVVTDLLLSMLYRGRELERSMEGTAEGEALDRKLDALGHALRPGRRGG